MKEIARRISLPYLLIVFGVVITFPGVEWLGSIARIAGIPALLAWLLSIVVTGKFRNLTTFHFLNILFIAWCLGSYFWSVDEERTIAKTYRLLLPFGLSMLMWDLYKTKAQVYNGLQWIVYGGYFIALSVLKNYSEGTFALNQRFSAVGMHPNDVPRLFGIAIPIAWALATEMDTSRINRVLNYAFPVIALYVMLLTASRGGIASALPSFVYIIWTFRKASPTVKGAFLVAALLIAVVGVKKLGSSLETQLLRLTQTSDLADANGRIDIWRKGFDLAAKHPISGIGFGGFQEATRGDALQRDAFNEPLVAHNTYLSVFAETGAIGAGLFIALILSLFLYIRNIKTPMRAALFTSLIVWGVAVLSSVWEEHNQTWLLFTLIVITAKMSIPEKEVMNVDQDSVELGPTPFEPLPSSA